MIFIDQVPEQETMNFAVNNVAIFTHNDPAAAEFSFYYFNYLGPCRVDCVQLRKKMCFFALRSTVQLYINFMMHALLCASGRRRRLLKYSVNEPVLVFLSAHAFFICFVC